jgi:hypothetical protein
MQINPFTWAAAQADLIAAFERDPTGTQAELNSCFELLASGRGQVWVSGFIGSLVAKGVRPDQAIVQLAANVLLTGVYLQRRLGNP